MSSSLATTPNPAEGAFSHRPLLHPIALLAFGVLVLNDHFLKSAHPSWLTGKLSDVSFMILAPLWLAIGAALLIEVFRREELPLSLRAQRRLLVTMIASVLVLFSSMQLTEAGDAFYRVTLGVLQWPARAVWQLFRDGALPSLSGVVSTPDPSDLICLPFLLVAWEIGKPRSEVC